MAPSAVLFDIDGVLVVSWHPIPGAVDAMETVRSSGYRTMLLTNTTSRTASEIATMLRTSEFPIDGDELLTAGVATAGHLRRHHPGAACLILNDGPLDDFGDVHLVAPGAQPDVVVIGSAGPSFTWEHLNDAARAVAGGAALVAMHGASVFQTDGGISIDGGAYVAALEQATGVTATVVGKPAPEMFAEALRTAECEPHEAVMVGDDVTNDVLAAQALGITGVLVRTGKFREETLAAAEGTPDYVIDSVADLPALLDEL